ncbi:MAG: signal peptidase II [Candidatus Woesearchaeota archaeon]
MSTVNPGRRKRSNLSLHSILLDVISSRMFMIAAIIFAIDRVSKYIAIGLCPCVLGPFFNVIVSKNPGVAFGFFKGIVEANLFFTVTTIVISLFLVYLFMVAREPYMRIGLSLMFGGALGNLFDRLFYGAVIDVLDFHISIWRFPAFNFADAAITAGAIMIIWGILVKERKSHPKAKKHDQKEQNSSSGNKSSQVARKRKSSTSTSRKTDNRNRKKGSTEKGSQKKNSSSRKDSGPARKDR